MIRLPIRTTTCLSILAAVLASSCASWASEQGQSNRLDFEARVEAQRAIEEVYWRHRVWPSENPGLKPPLEAVLPDAQIRARVTDYLRKSKALEALWHRPINGDQLQAEMDRMAAHSRDPQGLRELYAALGDDSFLIAETLARQTLADRLIRNWYARDEGVHGELRRRAEARIEGAGSEAELAALDGVYRERTWRLEQDGVRARTDRDDISLDLESWQERLALLAAVLAPTELEHSTVTPTSLPSMTISALQENDDSFYVTSIVGAGDDWLTEATVSWPKTPFDAWWAAYGDFATDVVVADRTFHRADPGQTGACETERWLPTNMGPPTARRGHTAVWTGTEMIVWGGQGFGDLVPGARYNPSTDHWLPVSIAGAPELRSGHRALWTGSQMIVWGGDFRGNNGGLYDPVTDSWVPMATAGAPTTRDGWTSVWTGQEMIVWGGGVNTGARYRPATNLWTATTTAGAPAARHGHTAVWTGTEMLIWGGLATPVAALLPDGARYDPFADSWLPMTTSGAATARFLHSAVWTGHEMIVWGGNAGPDLNTGTRYDPSIDTWSPMSASGAPAARNGHVVVWTGSEMIVWGGAIRVDTFTNPPVNTGGRYDPATDSWSATTTSGAPTARSSHTGLWSGSELIVWGGSARVDAFNIRDVNSGGRYDPATDRWVPTSTAAPPSGRVYNSAVWTGNEMIVWGGGDSFGNTSTGARYVPATQSWEPTATLNAPTARYAHTAVWTGTEMIVWGGTSTPSPGGHYNPSTDSWVDTNPIGAPTPRSFHSAVWTGSEMIVWGGSFEYSGGRYDPGTRTWRPTDETYAPEGRRYHAAVWTGNEMIVWGGEAPFGGFPNSSRYDPSTDSWWEASPVGEPFPGRQGHTAVWTGKEMIVWGGAPQGIAPNPNFEGGRYDPILDVWKPMSLAGAPSYRESHSAVWTGDAMIVWGGFRPGSEDTGGRYYPSVDRWIATPTTGAPSARWDHTAVWTGDSMIVWGGFGGLNTGGEYRLGNEGAACEDGNLCTIAESCRAGTCTGDLAPVGASCGDPTDDVCRNPDTCDAYGSCQVHDEPAGTACANDGNACTLDECGTSGACMHIDNDTCGTNPASQGYWRRLCKGPHPSGEFISPADLDCVNDSCTFAAVENVAELCDRMNADPRNDKCEKGEAQLMALLLNTCRTRVSDSMAIESDCDDDDNCNDGDGDEDNDRDDGHDADGAGSTTVGESRAEADDLLCDPARGHDECARAQCISEEINSGEAFGFDTLRVERVLGGVRLTWNPPYHDPIYAAPRYVIARSSLPDGVFTPIAETTDLEYVDTTSNTGSHAYDVRPVW